MSCVGRWGACGSVLVAILKFRINAFVQRPEHDERDGHADIQGRVCIHQQQQMHEGWSEQGM